MDDTLAVITFLAIVAAILIIPAMVIMDNQWKMDTVNRGLALYCPNDGQWAWKGECE